MIVAAAILFFTVVVNSQDIAPVRDYRLQDYRNPYNYYDESPKPFAFNYNAPLEDGGQSSRAEAADGTGKVQGSYSVTNDEGHTRVVDYVADEGGFRASVRTNEPGTENKNPADVVIESAAPLAYSPYQYNQYNAGLRRPIVPAAVNPADPFSTVPVVPAAVDPVAPLSTLPVVPDNLLVAGQPSLYNLPNAYRNRNAWAAPYSQDPYSRDPYNADLYNRDPYNRNPYNRNTYNRNPYNRNLYNRNIYNRNPSYRNPTYPY